jgi:hypothetical protein
MLTLTGSLDSLERVSDRVSGELLVGMVFVLFIQPRTISVPEIWVESFVRLGGEYSRAAVLNQLCFFPYNQTPAYQQHHFPQTLCGFWVACASNWKVEAFQWFAML